MKLSHDKAEPVYRSSTPISYHLELHSWTIFSLLTYMYIYINGFQAMGHKHNCGVPFVECMAYDNVPCVLFFFFHAYFFFGLTDMQATGRKADESRHSHMVRTCQS